MTEFPDYCLRGIRNRSGIREQYGRVQVYAKAYKPDTRSKDWRTDGWIATSINWEDDEEALKDIFENTEASAYGAARLARNHLDDFKANPNTHDIVDYERAPLPDNRYHGNIVFRNGSHEGLINMLCGTLALESIFIPRPDS